MQPSIVITREAHLRTDRHSRHLSKVTSTFSTCRRSERLWFSCDFSGLLRRPSRLDFGIVRAFVTATNVMFRISTIETAQERKLVVEGTLMAPWVAELRKTWGAAGAGLEGRLLVIDLRGVTRIDAAGEAAILELMEDGARFSCSGVLNRHVLKQLEQKCHSRAHRVNQMRSKQR